MLKPQQFINKNGLFKQKSSWMGIFSQMSWLANSLSVWFLV